MVRTSSCGFIGKAVENLSGMPSRDTVFTRYRTGSNVRYRTFGISQSDQVSLAGRRAGWSENLKV